MMKNQILTYIDEHKEEYIEFLQEIIQVNSYNPPGNEKDVAVEIQNYFNSFGIFNELFPLENNRANFIASLNEDYSGNTLLYTGHMDVVPPGDEDEWKYPPLSAHVKRSKYMYGRGTSDMKGGLTAMAIALQIIEHFDISTDKNLAFLAVSDEEVLGEIGTKWSVEHILEERNIDCKFAIVGECTGLPPLPKGLIVGEKGHITLKITAHGIECHSSIPFEGKNAIYMISDIIQNLNTLKDYIEDVPPPMTEKELKDNVSEIFPNKEIFEKIFNEQPRLQDFIKSLKTFTKSVNIIDGGIKDNVVPGKCEAIMDFRTFPGIDAKIIINGLTSLIEDQCNYQVMEQHQKKNDEIYVNLELIHEIKASYWEDWKSSTKLKTLKKNVEEIYGKTSFYSLFPGASDARYLRNSGYCPQTVVFGPGDGAKVHSVDEYIEIEDFINVLKVYTLFAYNYLTE